MIEICLFFSDLEQKSGRVLRDREETAYLSTGESFWIKEKKRSQRIHISKCYLKHLRDWRCEKYFSFSLNWAMNPMSPFLLISFCHISSAFYFSLFSSHPCLYILFSSPIFTQRFLNPSFWLSKLSLIHVQCSVLFCYLPPVIYFLIPLLLHLPPTPKASLCFLITKYTHPYSGIK